MNVINKNLETHQGDADDFRFEFSDDNGAIDVTGYSFEIKVADKIGGTVLWSLSTPTDIEITDATNGKVTVHFKSTDTTSMSGNYVYTLKATDTSSKVHTFSNGRLTVYEVVS